MCQFQAGIIFTLLGAADVVEEKEVQQKMRGKNANMQKMFAKMEQKMRGQYIFSLLHICLPRIAGCVNFLSTVLSLNVQGCVL